MKWPLVMLGSAIYMRLKMSNTVISRIRIQYMMFHEHRLGMPTLATLWPPCITLGQSSFLVEKPRKKGLVQSVAKTTKLGGRSTEHANQRPQSDDLPDHDFSWS